MTAVISFLWRFSLFYSNSFWSVGPNFRVSQIGSQFSSEIMQDGGEFFEIFVFFFQTIIAGNFIWPSHLSSPKCLHIRHKDIFFSLLAVFLRVLTAKLQKVLLVLFFLFEIYNNAISEEEKLSEFSKKSFMMLKIFLCHNENGFCFQSRTSLKKPCWTPLRDFLTKFGKKRRNWPFFPKNRNGKSKLQSEARFFRQTDRLFSVLCLSWC